MQAVRLIALTQPTEEMTAETGMETAEDLIAYCARVSNPSNQENFDTAPKLLKYCIKKKHWSIFEMTNIIMEIKTTRDIGRQILRHRSFSFQEFSQRYAKVDVDSFNTREARLQDVTNRQNSIELDMSDIMHAELAHWWEGQQKAVASLVSSIYEEALKRGLAKEQARAILPEGMSPSTMYMNGSLRSWVTYVSIREQESTQKEHREIAKMVKSILIKNFPFLEDALGNIDTLWNV